MAARTPTDRLLAKSAITENSTALTVRPNAGKIMAPRAGFIDTLPGLITQTRLSRAMRLLLTRCPILNRAIPM